MATGHADGIVIPGDPAARHFLTADASTLPMIGTFAGLVLRPGHPWRCVGPHDARPAEYLIYRMGSVDFLRGSRSARVDGRSGQLMGRSATRRLRHGSLHRRCLGESGHGIGASRKQDGECHPIVGRRRCRAASAYNRQQRCATAQCGRARHEPSRWLSAGDCVTVAGTDCVGSEGGRDGSAAIRLPGPTVQPPPRPRGAR
jgi:hypothetical protein